MSPQALSILDPTFTVEELCARWHCGKSRVYAIMARPDFPAGAKIGRHRVWTAQSIYAWEKRYLPELHVQVEEQQADEEWNSLRRQIQWDQIQRQREAPAKKRRREVRRPR